MNIFLIRYYKPYSKSHDSSVKNDNFFFTFHSTNDAITVFKTAQQLGLTGESYIWISNQQSLESDVALQLAPQGTQ